MRRCRDEIPGTRTFDALTSPRQPVSRMMTKQKIGQTSPKPPTLFIAFDQAPRASGRDIEKVDVPELKTSHPTLGNIVINKDLPDLKPHCMS